MEEKKSIKLACTKQSWKREHYNGKDEGKHLLTHALNVKVMVKRMKPDVKRGNAKNHNMVVGTPTHTQIPTRKHERTFQGKTPAKTCSPD